jgi:hypothetical protein
MVLFLGYVIIFVVTRFISSRNDYNKKQFVLRLCSTVLAGVVIIFCTFFMRNLCQAGMSALVNSQSSIVLSDSDMIYSDIADQDAVTFEHENENIDSGRFTLWSQAMTIFAHYPIIGIGKGNLLSYSYQFFKDGMHFADLYSGDFSGLFASFTTDIHNAYITILVCSGVIGFLLFMIFAVRNGFAITKFLFKSEKTLDGDIFHVMFSFAVSYLFFACFEKAVLYDISFMVIMFWFVLGQIMCYNIREPRLNTHTTFKESMKSVLL